MRNLLLTTSLASLILRAPEDGGAGGEPPPELTPPPPPEPDKPAPEGQAATSPSDRLGRIAAAVLALDDANDSHWTADGLPSMSAVEAIFGDTTPTRAEVAIVGRLRRKPAQDGGVMTSAPIPEPDTTSTPPASTSHGTAPADAPAAPVVTITPGRIVLVKPASGIDGEAGAVGIVVKVNGDDSVNVKAFSPNGGADVTYTGVRHAAEVDAMPEGADKNAAASCVWDWPPRA